MDALTLHRLVITTTKVTVEANCKLWGEDPSVLELLWSLHKKNNQSQWDTLDIEPMVQIPISRKFLVIRQNALQGCSSYMAKIKAQFKGGPVGYTYIMLNTHCQPRWGNCSVTPKAGTTSNNYSFTCENWKDFRNESDLHYYYYYNIAPYNLPVLFAHTMNPSIKKLVLPAGLEAFNYEVEVKIVIMDRVEAINTEILRVKVRDRGSLVK
jgi:hypothetical protein